MKVLLPALHLVDYTTDPYIENPNVAEQIDQTLARLIAHDNVSGFFKFVTLDKFGALRTTRMSPKLIKNNGYSINTSSTLQAILPRNDNRVQATIINTGKYAASLFYNDFQDNNAVIPLSPGDVLIEDVYCGTILGVQNISATTLRVIELS